MPERRTFMQAIGTGLGSAALIGTAAGDTTMVNTKIETEDMDGENSYELECSRMMCKEGHIDDVKIVVNGGTVENISIGSAVMGGEEMDDGMTNQIEDFLLRRSVGSSTSLRGMRTQLIQLARSQTCSRSLLRCSSDPIKATQSAFHKLSNSSTVVESWTAT